MTTTPTTMENANKIRKVSFAKETHTKKFLDKKKLL